MGGKEEGRRKEIETKYGDEEKGKIHNNNDIKFQNRQLSNKREFNLSNYVPNLHMSNGYVCVPILLSW